MDALWEILDKIGEKKFHMAKDIATFFNKNATAGISASLF